MATVAGAPEESNAASTSPAPTTGRRSLVRCIDFYSDDIIDIFYTEPEFAPPLRDDLRLQFALQYRQQSTGDACSVARRSSSSGAARSSSASGCPVLGSAHQRRRRHRHPEPSSSYPGYTSVQVEDLTATARTPGCCAPPTIPVGEGLSLYGLWVNGSDPQDPGSPAKDDSDLNLQWTSPAAPEGLMMRLRYSPVSQDDPANSDLDDLRLMIYRSHHRSGTRCSAPLFFFFLL